MILTVHGCDWAAHLAPHHLPYCVHLWDCRLHLLVAHLNNAHAHSTLVSAVVILTPSTPVFGLTVSLSVSAALIPAWAQLKHFSCPSAPGLWWQLFACEVPVRGLHYTLLKKTLFDLTRFYFEGPSLKNSHRWPLSPPSLFPPLLIILDQKREKNM